MYFHGGQHGTFSVRTLTPTHIGYTREFGATGPRSVVDNTNKFTQTNSHTHTYNKNPHRHMYTQICV